MAGLCPRRLLRHLLLAVQQGERRMELIFIDTQTLEDRGCGITVGQSNGDITRSETKSFQSSSQKSKKVQLGVHGWISDHVGIPLQKLAVDHVGAALRGRMGQCQTIAKARVFAGLHQRPISPQLGSILAAGRNRRPLLISEKRTTPTQSHHHFWWCTARDAQRWDRQLPRTHGSLTPFASGLQSTDAGQDLPGGSRGCLSAPENLRPCHKCSPWR